VLFGISLCYLPIAESGLLANTVLVDSEGGIIVVVTGAVWD